ncbi:hypothetical protein BJ508DRAFT_215925, partial [Ascobolus immersus RN42]
MAHYASESRRTRVRLDHYYWHQMSKDVLLYCDHCLDCLTKNTNRQKAIGQLQPLPVSSSIPLRDITIDLVTHLPECRIAGYGNTMFNAVMTRSCRLSKAVSFIPGRSDWSSEDWAKCILNHWWGLPASMVTDRDKRF